MYTLTLIRLSLDNKVFENTEAHNFMLIGSVQRELDYHNASSEQIEEFLKLEKGSNTVICIENEKENKLWFYYIHRIA